jgi:hypothetical protein
MNKRQIKKIIKKHGRWCPMPENFLTIPGTMEATYFSCGGREKRVPYRKLRKLWPYCVDNPGIWFFKEPICGVTWGRHP